MEDQFRRNGWQDFSGSEGQACSYVVHCVVGLIKPWPMGAEPAICLADDLRFESCRFRWEVTAGLGPGGDKGEGETQGI